jgi:hypothetical protein
MFFAQRTAPKALLMTFFAATKMIFVDDFGSGIVADNFCGLYRW